MRVVFSSRSGVRRARAALSVIAALVLAAPPARAGGRARLDPQALVERGVSLYRDADYAGAVAALERARQGHLETEVATECSFYLAAGYVALGSTAAARRELRALLEAQPGYELPQYTSPKVAALFAEVKDALAHSPALRALPPRRLGPTRVELWFQTANENGTAYGAARWRWRGDRDWREAPLAHQSGRLLASLDVDRGGTLEYYAEARGPAGLAEAASADRPLELPVVAAPGMAQSTSTLPGSVALVATHERPRKRSIARAWWLWTTVSVVVAAGAGVGLYFALRPPPATTADAVLNFQVQ